MSKRSWLRPVTVAAVLVPLTLWAVWGSIELYWEGWGLPFPEPLFYLAPMAIIWFLALTAITWPRLGGWLMIVIGGGLGAWVFSLQIARADEFTIVWALTWFVVALLPAVTGIAFLFEARRRRSAPAPTTFFERYGDRLIVMAVPLLVFGAASAYWLPVVLTRVDDGNRGAVEIETPVGVLRWAPAGPGWNQRTESGGYPSWSAIALYGRRPAGIESKSTVDATVDDMASTCLCGYLDEAGTTLSDEWVGAWRMPTTAEVVASLVRDGETAGCELDESSRSSTCEVTPDKETPLWAPDQSPIYLWTSDMPAPEEAEYVGYNGSIGSQPIDWGNPRHGYRCVQVGEE